MNLLFEKFSFKVISDFFKPFRAFKFSGIPSISKVTFKPSEDRTHFEILTEGINFPGFYKYPEMLDLNRISTNDVNAFRNAYGIEAAVMTMQREIDKVFKPYGYVSLLV